MKNSFLPVVYPAILMLFLINCKTKTNNNAPLKTDSLEIVKTTCADYLFLGFCQNMGSKEYHLIESDLIKQNDLKSTNSGTKYILYLKEDSLFNFSVNIEFDIKPRFENDSLIEVTLISENGAHYSQEIEGLYNIKYGQPIKSKMEKDQIFQTKRSTKIWQTKYKVITITKYCSHIISLTKESKAENPAKHSKYSQPIKFYYSPNIPKTPDSFSIRYQSLQCFLNEQQQIKNDSLENSKLKKEKSHKTLTDI